MKETNAQVVGLDEIVFENRHKEYGAYELRKTYRSTLTKAVFIGSSLFLMAMTTPTLMDLLPDNKGKLSMTEHEVFILPPPAKEERIIEPKIETPKPIATIAHPVPIIVTEPDEEQVPPTIEEMQNKVVASETRDGEESELAPIEEPTQGRAEKQEVAIAEVDVPMNSVFERVEQSPEFAGNVNAYLASNIKYPRQAANSNISGKVFLDFVVNTDGSIQDVQVSKGIGFGCDEEAMRVLKAMPKWRPGKQSGRPVRVRYHLPVSFVLE